jgi:hypothetical protein
MSLDVGEAKRQLSKDKTAIVQYADGELYYLRGITDFEAIGEPLEGGDERRHLLASVWQVTGYDSDEEGLVKDPRVTKAKRQRVVAGSSSSMHQRSGSSISVLPAVAAVQAKQPTGCEQMVSKGFPREPGTSAATSAAASGAAASSAPPPPVPLPPFSPRTDSPGTALGNPKRTALVEYAMLTRRYPLHHARDALHDDVADKLRRMEKYEIALQGDDYADKEHQKTNHEALAYARAAASVASMTNCKLSELCAGQLDGAVARLKQEPYISDFRARRALPSRSSVWPRTSCKPRSQCLPASPLHRLASRFTPHASPQLTASHPHTTTRHALRFRRDLRPRAHGHVRGAHCL